MQLGCADATKSAFFNNISGEYVAHVSPKDMRYIRQNGVGFGGQDALRKEIKMGESISTEEKIASVVRQLPKMKKTEVLDFAEWLSQKIKPEEESKPKRMLPMAIAKLVEEGKLELSDCSDFGLNEDWFVPKVTLEELREQLKDVSVPIEEYIRCERDKREML